MNPEDRRPWNQTSASQHDAFLRCQRYWFQGWIEREVPRETTPAQQRGKDIHAEVEHFLHTGEVRDSCYTEFNLNYRPYVESIKPFLPPRDNELIIEQRVWLETGLGVGWLGFIDVGHSGQEPLVLRDYKSTSDFRYCKTPEELLDNVQLMSYAQWAYTLGHQGEIDVGQIYVKTEKKVVRKKPKVKLVNIVVDRDHVQGVWDREMATVEEMKVAALAPSFNDLPPTTSACSMFGGCPFQAKCGLGAAEMLSSLFKPKGPKETGMGFLKNLKRDAKNAKKDEPKEETKKTEKSTSTTKAKKSFGASKKKKGTKPSDGQIVSDDAPSREVEETETETETKTSPPATAKKKANGSNGKSFAIFIDCYPTKDVNRDGVDPTLFEDWFGPMVMEMNTYCQEKKDVSNYLLLGFSEEKAMVSMAVQDAIENDRLPPVMIVNSGVPSAKDALGHLIPHASMVVRSQR